MSKPATPPHLPVLAAALATALGACAPAPEPVSALDAPASTPEGDVLAPEVYAFAGPALWDGLPSLGGVWVAHPEVEAPARVRIVAAGTGAAVTGALFRRERLDDEPPMRVSAAAAEALGLAAGEPATLEVTALRPPEAFGPPPAAATLDAASTAVEPVP